jgi:rare lipoprotein A
MRPTILLTLALLTAAPLRSQPSETGSIGVYADLYQGKATASGAPYDRAAMTAAHPTLPFGTWVRVANFETGRMADLLVNDRKKPDSRLVIVSRAAADALGLAPNKVAPGSLLVIAAPAPVAVSVPPLPTTSTPPSATAPAPTLAPAPSATMADNPAERRFRPFAALFGKEAGDAAENAPDSVRYAIPGDRYAPPAAGGGWNPFKPSAPPPAAYPSPYPSPTQPPALPAPARSGDPALLAMNAPIPPPSIPGSVPSPPPAPAPAPTTAAPPVGTTALPPASPTHPYRAQFGAYRRLASAEELAAMLRGAGIPVSIFAAQATGLNVVVTDGGFRSAEEAQRWIDFEAARRGWTERPVVVR